GPKSVPARASSLQTPPTSLDDAASQGSANDKDGCRGPRECGAPRRLSELLASNENLLIVLGSESLSHGATCMFVRNPIGAAQTTRNARFCERKDYTRGAD